MSIQDCTMINLVSHSMVQDEIHCWMSSLDNITVQNSYGQITATNVWGALNGLETFSQLLYIDADNHVSRMYDEHRLSSAAVFSWQSMRRSKFRIGPDFRTVVFFWIPLGTSYLSHWSNNIWSVKDSSVARLQSSRLPRTPWSTTNSMCSIGISPTINRGRSSPNGFLRWPKRLIRMIFTSRAANGGCCYSSLGCLYPWSYLLTCWCPRDHRACSSSWYSHYSRIRFSRPCGCARSRFSRLGECMTRLS